MKPFSTLVATATLIVASHATASAGSFTVEQTESGFTVKIGGELFTRYVTDQANKPYFYPIIGPTGKSMTRAYPMEMVEGERRDHPHHRGINFGHHNVNGYNTWLERKTFAKKLKGKSLAEVEEALSGMGSTEHRGIDSITVTEDRAIVVVSNDYLDREENRMMTDQRTYTFRAPDADSRIIDVDIVLSAPPHGIAVLHDEKDAGLSIRVNHDLSVDAEEGGLLINSKGDTNKDAWGKRALWCDYNGKIDGEAVGVAFMNHPDSFRHPTPWHARTYGLLTANPFGTKSVASESDGSITLKDGESITLKHRFLFHSGDHKSANIDAAYKRYASE